MLLTHYPPSIDPAVQQRKSGRIRAILPDKAQRSRQERASKMDERIDMAKSGRQWVRGLNLVGLICK
jgi:hypothetical protein